METKDMKKTVAIYIFHGEEVRSSTMERQLVIRRYDVVKLGEADTVELDNFEPDFKFLGLLVVDLDGIAHLWLSDEDKLAVNIVNQHIEPVSDAQNVFYSVNDENEFERISLHIESGILIEKWIDQQTKVEQSHIKKIQNQNIRSSKYVYHLQVLYGSHALYDYSADGFLASVKDALNEYSLAAAAREENEENEENDNPEREDDWDPLNATYFDVEEEEEEEEEKYFPYQNDEADEKRENLINSLNRDMMTIGYENDYDTNNHLDEYLRDAEEEEDEEEEKDEEDEEDEDNEDYLLSEEKMF